MGTYFRMPYISEDVYFFANETGWQFKTKVLIQPTTRYLSIVCYLLAEAQDIILPSFDMTVPRLEVEATKAY